MRMPLLEDCEKEVRRLAVAGSRLAVGDFRLKRLIEPLNKLGAKAPVFQKVAEAIQRLVDGSETESATHFLRLATLIHAILYTQAQDLVEETGEVVSGGEFAFLIQPKSAKRVREIHWALTQSGSGRLEVLHSANQSGMLMDLRWVSPSIRALEDGYGELADFVLDAILPLYGKAVLSEVKEGITLKGNQGSARRLIFWHRTDPKGARETVLECLDHGSKTMKLAALGCLSPDGRSIPSLTPLLKSKDFEVVSRVVAVLAQSEEPKVQQQIVDKVFEDEAVSISSIVFNSGHPELLTRIFDRMRILVTQASEKKRPFALMVLGLECFLGSNELLEISRDVNWSSPGKYSFARNWNAQLENSLYPFLLEAFASREKKKSKTDSAERVWIYGVMDGLLRIGREDGLRLVMEDLDHSDPHRLRGAFIASFRLLSPEKSFEQFSSTFLADKKDKAVKADKNRITALSEALSFVPQKNVDARWLDLVTKKELLDLTCHLMRPGHAAAWDLLISQLDRSKLDLPVLFKGLIRTKHPDRVKHLAGYMKKNPYAQYFLKQRLDLLDPQEIQELKNQCPDLDLEG